MRPTMPFGYLWVHSQSLPLAKILAAASAKIHSALCGFQCPVLSCETSYAVDLFRFNCQMSNIEELITSFRCYIVSGLWVPPALARVALSCAGSRKPFSDPIPDLVSEPFRTRFWDPLGDHFVLFFGPSSELAA